MKRAEKTKMVRRYKRKTEQHSWSMQAMKQAVHSIISGEMGYKKASNMHNVPQTTLEHAEAEEAAKI
ncbi:hypothetical protein MSG28_011993 [Choristoneura fumiferana]|uniref:Uncharacterized protein n=1 Tax=Choristoneura fumiferana TaxID=7141 RepID=A0ACC0KMR4_CHOFU|nr:hypothetical protein MSG28_011993 [Choristoneura fumiferana]